MKELFTRWGKNMNPEHVLEEYPRPLMRRDSYVCLNGMWDYAFTREFHKPGHYEGKILVPFSPESLLSGVKRQLQPDEYLWYHRTLVVNSGELKAGKHLLLHFGAVDQGCCIYVNGQEVMRHVGGYLPFSCDITAFLNYEEGNTQELLVAVRDLSDTSYHARGKQKLERGGMFYTAQSGIWQTVWMEYVPKQAVEELTTEPDADGGWVSVTVKNTGGQDLPISIRIQSPTVEVSSEDASVSRTSSDVLVESEGMTNHPVTIHLPVVKKWNCDEPWLYYFTVTLGEDQVESYFALRTFTIEPDAQGMPRICLNHRVQYQNGVLDQGYWSDGLYTAPSDEAMLFDIQSMKKMGFNMIRKHIKIEPQRWYYHCDRLGMVVWQDMVNGGGTYKTWLVTYAGTFLDAGHIKVNDKNHKLLAREDARGRKEYVREMKATIQLLRSHPCIAAWILFNEGWGQFDSAKMVAIARKQDPTRLIDGTSGWFDQGAGDMVSTHNYSFKLKTHPEKKRVSVLAEYGGYSIHDKAHTVCDQVFGYQMYETKEDLAAAVKSRLQEVAAQVPLGLCASVYTQVSDVEEEVNGIFTYDREVQKIDDAAFKSTQCGHCRL
jgi:beta-galactosidase/beta-glucuronidase